MTLASRPRAARALLQLCVSVQPEYRQSASEGKEGAALRRGGCTAIEDGSARQHLHGCSGTAHFCEAAELATCKALGIQVALLQRLKQLIIRARSCAAGAVIELAQYAAEAGL